MEVTVPFTNNYSDLSTDQGHQFEFFCQRCGNGYRSSLKADAVTNIGSKATKGLGGMFGGKLSKVASQADAALHNVADSKMQEKAFQAAVNEMQGKFYRCNVCRDWVCEENCWDTDYGLCTTCAAPQREQAMNADYVAPSVPRPQVAAAAQQVAAAFSGVIAQAKSAMTCSSCGASHAAGAKFCPECGQALNLAPTCSNCGTEAAPGTKFCANCGQSLLAG